MPVRSRWIGVALWLCMATWVQAGELAGMRIEQPDDPSAPVWRSQGPLPAALEAELELGTSTDGARLTLEPAQPGGEYRVQVQYQTSMSVGADGPHLDLVDWKHCASGWVAAQQDGAHRFVLPTPTQAQQQCFPAYGQQDLIQAVRDYFAKEGFAENADFWLTGLQHRDQATVLPSVGISAVKVRVQVLRDGHWRPVTTLTLKRPMGC
jgi:hypothetical protein